MTRKEFVDTLCDSIATGRKRNHPDIRPSEAAMSRMSDRKVALNLWAKHRDRYKDTPIAEFSAELNRKEN